MKTGDKVQIKKSAKNDIDSALAMYLREKPNAVFTIVRDSGWK